MKKIKRIFKNPITVWIRSACCWLFYVAYFPWLYYQNLRNLKKLPHDTQIFLLTRTDLGTMIDIMNYADNWQKCRSRTCIINLNPNFPLIKLMAHYLAPESTLISNDTVFLRVAVFLFGHDLVHLRILGPLYAFLRSERLNALHQWHFYTSSLSKKIFPVQTPAYIQEFDSILNDQMRHTLPHSFVETYLKFRKKSCACNPVQLDTFKLAKIAQKNGISPNKELLEHLDRLKQTLGLTKEYVLININCKNYGSYEQNRRIVNKPQTYNVLIDFLIEQNFSVVIQGRKEQPYLKARDGLIDYAHSSHASRLHDMALYAGAKFVISNKTGPEFFAHSFDRPLLGLNYSELAVMITPIKYRFYPKGIRDVKSGEVLMGKRWLNAPAFFNYALWDFQAVEYIDLTEGELLEATQEFLGLVIQNSWGPSPRQKAFKREVTPLHLGLHYSAGLPCDAFLQKHGF